MTKHNNNNRKILKLFKFLSDEGFDIQKIKKGNKIIHTETNKFYILHSTDKGFHPLRRWLNYNFQIQITV